MFRAEDIPLSLYIHLPWCDKKCPYCDFNSHLLRDQRHFGDYTGAMISQLRGWSELFQSRKIKTVYFGGGTPNLFPLDLIKILLKEIHSVMDIEEHSEISFEVNPLNMHHNSSIEEYNLYFFITKSGHSLPTTNPSLSTKNAGHLLTVIALYFLGFWP